MKVETQLIDGYWGLLSNLNPSLKLKLIERLSKSVSRDIIIQNDRFFSPTSKLAIIIFFPLALIIARNLSLNSVSFLSQTILNR